MFRGKLPNPAYRDDDPRIVFVLRWATEPPPRQWDFFFRGCAVECVLLGLAVLAEAGLGTGVEQQSKPTKSRPVTVLYVPPVRKEAPKPPPPDPKVAPHRAPAVPAEPPAPAVPQSKVKIDLSALVISVVDDTGDQLPAVVSQQKGASFALVEQNDPTYARYVFDPPDWRMKEGFVDLSRRIRFNMTPASRWPLIQSLAASNGIPMERYQLNAVFDGAFSECLKQEIRSHATSSSAAGRVSAVVLAFNSSRSCGIDVLHVEFAPAQ